MIDDIVTHVANDGDADPYLLTLLTRLKTALKSVNGGCSPVSSGTTFNPAAAVGPASAVSPAATVNPAAVSPITFTDDDEDDDIQFETCTASRETFKKEIRRLLDQRDALWKERLELSHRNKDILKKCPVERSTTTQKIIHEQRATIDRLTNECLQFKRKVDDQENTITCLKKQVTSLIKDLDAGKRIIRQFSDLMKDKTDNICQYCRRSGTLPPLPTR